MTQMKICTKCDTEKPEIAFSKHTRSRDRLQSHCKSCNKSYLMAYRAEHSAEIKAHGKTYRAEHSEEIEAYRVEHRNEKVSYDKAYHVEHREERLKCSKSYYASNKKAMGSQQNLYRVRRYHSDINFRLTHLLRNRLKTVLKSDAKAGSAICDLGCTTLELLAYLESRWEPGWSWDNHGAEWQIDHVRPLASFDLTDRRQFLMACHWANLQPLSAIENAAKGDKWNLEDLACAEHTRMLEYLISGRQH